MLLNTFITALLLAVSLTCGTFASEHNPKDRVDDIHNDKALTKITKTNKNENEQKVSAERVAIKTMSISDFAKTHYTYDSKLVLDDLAEAVDPQGRLDACGRAKNARFLLAKMATAYTDENCKWSKSPVSENGQDPCFESYGGIALFKKVMNSLMEMLVEIDEKQFETVPPQLKEDWDGKTKVQPEIFQEALKDAEARVATERKHIIPVLQNALTIILRTRSRTLVSDFMIEKAQLERYQDYMERMNQISWRVLFKIIEKTGESARQYHKFTTEEVSLLEDSLRLLPLSQRTKEITPAELEWLEADGSWSILKPVVLAMVKVVPGTGKEKVSTWKVARKLDEAGMVAIFGICEEMRQMKDALIGYARKQMDVNSNSEWQKRVTAYEEELKEWEENSEPFDFLVGTWTSNKDFFPVDINVKLLDNVAINKYSILEGIIYYQIDLLGEIGGLAAFQYDRDVIPVELRAQATRQKERLIALKKAQLEYFVKSGESLRNVYERSLSLVLQILRDDEKHLQKVQETLLKTSVDGPHAESITTRALGIDPVSHLEWFDLQAHLEGFEGFRKPKIAQVREEKLAINAKRKETLKIIPDIRNLDSLDEDMKNYLLHTNSHLPELRKIPFLKRIQIDEALANILKDSIPTMQKFAEETIEGRISAGTFQELTQDPGKEADPQTTLRAGFRELSDIIQREVEKAVKPVQKESDELFRVIDEVLPLRRDCKKAELYLKDLINLDAAQQAWWLASLQLSSPTLTSQDTSELILRQIYAIDYLTEQHELAEKARAYLASWEDVAERLHLGNKENWSEIRRVKNIALDLKANIVKPNLIKTNPIAGNIKTIIDDIIPYLENAKTIITITNSKDPLWNLREKLELWDELYTRRESLFFLRAILEHFNHHASFETIMSDTSRKEFLEAIDKLLKTIESIRVSLKNQFPVEKVGKQNTNDYDKPPKVEDLLARSKEYISQSDGQPSRWWYEFPETSDMAGVKVVV